MSFIKKLCGAAAGIGLSFLAASPGLAADLIKGPSSRVPT